MPHACAFLPVCTLPSAAEGQAAGVQGAWHGGWGRVPALPHTVCILVDTAQRGRAGLSASLCLYTDSTTCLLGDLGPSDLSPLSFSSSVK